MWNKYIIIKRDRKKSAILFDYFLDYTLVALIAEGHQIVSFGEFSVDACPNQEDPQNIVVIVIPKGITKQSNKFIQTSFEDSELIEYLLKGETKCQGNISS